MFAIPMRQEVNIMGEILKNENVCMYFHGLKAVDDISFTITDDEIFGIIGPNGAGKTTLFNVMTGFYEPTKGSVSFCGENMRKKQVYEFSRAGLARTFQNIRIFEQMTVEENILVGMHNTYQQGLFDVLLHTPKQKGMEKALRNEVAEIMEYLQISEYAHEQAACLPYGIQRKVEIARALASKPKMLLLDEPTAGMNQKESDDLAVLIREIFETRHIAVVVIEHNMQFIMGLTQKIAVLNFGKLIALGTPEEVQNNQHVIDAYLGEEDDK